MGTAFRTFAKDEHGAVTVDWVVLTAAVVGLGMLVLTSMGGAVTTAAEQIGQDTVNNASN
jgi:Flp pilus assembly pilin Flp